MSPRRCGGKITLTGMTRLCLALALAWAMKDSAPAQGAPRTRPAGRQEFIHEDAHITGREIHWFSQDSRRVSVVVGDFRLVAGEHNITGRDAVIWIDTKRKGDTNQHHITVYVEGDAKVVEPDGTTATDRTMLVTLPIEGQIIASGRLSSTSLEKFPLYRRAVKAKKGPTTRPATRPATQPVITNAGEGKAADTRPAIDTEEEVVQEQPDEDRRATPATVPATRPAKRASLPVRFRADKFTSEMRDGVRVTVASGNVYLAQGNPDSDLFMEMRSQSAVVFSRPYTDKDRPPSKDTASPVSPPLRGLPGPGGGEEVVTGVYLEDDVIIARGERYLRGPKAFYDFTTDRAIVPNAVFRTIQKNRDIPIYIRAEEFRALSAREIWFKNAKVTTSDFYTPTYHIGAKTAYLMDKTPYDPETGERLGERSWDAKIKHSTFNVRSIPFLYWPYYRADLTEGDTALHKAEVGSYGDFGIGVETEWDLFRALGLVEPEGFSGGLEIDQYKRGTVLGVTGDYDRTRYSGYWDAYGVIDQEQEDDFGDELEDIEAPKYRGRFLARHKQFLPADWMLQAEMSYIEDKNFLREFFPAEFWAGKEQETLLYAKKQRDNWAFTTLFKGQLNRFFTRAESAPDFGFHMIGQPLFGDNLTFFSESHAGAKRLNYANFLSNDDSDWFGRFDTREEIDWPLRLGPVNVVPYATGRLTYWGETPPETAASDDDEDEFRPYGQIGVKSNAHIWRVYERAQSRLWDVHGLKHIITPEVTGFLSTAGGVSPSDLYPLDPDIEQHLGRLSGAGFGIYQRLQTKRGPKGDRHTTDWMRLDIKAGVFDNPNDENIVADGRYFMYRPENSIGRNNINTEYTWHVSDSTTFLADTNFDVDEGDFGRAGAGLAVSRNPRLRYYLGGRYIRDLDSTVGTAGLRYQLTKKYSLSAFQQYDFEFNGGENMSTTFSFVRKFPRWYVGFTFLYDETQDDVGLILTVWPEGVPEFRIGSGRMSVLGRSSDRN